MTTGFSIFCLLAVFAHLLDSARSLTTLFNSRLKSDQTFKYTECKSLSSREFPLSQKHNNNRHLNHVISASSKDRRNCCRLRISKKNIADHPLFYHDSSLKYRSHKEEDQDVPDKEFAEKFKFLIKWFKNKKRKKDKNGKSEKDERWLSWLKQGKHPRDADALKLREPEELGGVPRADRYASKDWFHNAVNFPQSALLRDVSSPVLAISSWATIISVFHRHFLKHNPAAATFMCIPYNMHSLTTSALGLLLVFRTNSAYQRFVEGRKIWEQIQSTSRDLCRFLKLYEKPIGSGKRRRVQRLLAAFPYLLRHRIRPSKVMRKMNDPKYPRDTENALLLYPDHALNTDDEAEAIATSEEEFGTSRRKTRQLYWVDKRTLPWRLLPKNAMEGCARAQNRPLWVCDRMSKELATVIDGPSFTNRERLTLLAFVNKLSGYIGACERIHQTVVPLNYARHALRTLTVWLASLPFAAVDKLGLLTGPAIFIMSWMLFGIYEIGYSIEDPFQGKLRLSVLCDQIRRDVLENEVIMESAFKLSDPINNDVGKWDRLKDYQELNSNSTTLEKSPANADGVHNVMKNGQIGKPLDPTISSSATFQ